MIIKLLSYILQTDCFVSIKVIKKRRLFKEPTFNVRLELFTFDTVDLIVCDNYSEAFRHLSSIYNLISSGKTLITIDDILEESRLSYE